MLAKLSNTSRLDMLLRLFQKHTHTQKCYTKITEKNVCCLEEKKIYRNLYVKKKFVRLLLQIKTK